MHIPELIDGLNEVEFMAFPQKDNPKRVTLSVKGEDGKRYFLTRQAIGTNPDGTAKYQWVRGAQMRQLADKQNA